MGRYVGMTGVSGPLEGPMVDSVSGFLKALRKHRVCSSAGDNGSVIAWIADDGSYHAELCRFRQTLEAAQFKTKRQLAAWLTNQLPRQMPGVE